MYRVGIADQFEWNSENTKLELNIQFYNKNIFLVATIAIEIYVGPKNF